MENMVTMFSICSATPAVSQDSGSHTYCPLLQMQPGPLMSIYQQPLQVTYVVLAYPHTQGKVFCNTRVGAVCPGLATAAFLPLSDLILNSLTLQDTDDAEQSAHTTRYNLT